MPFSCTFSNACIFSLSQLSEPFSTGITFLILPLLGISSELWSGSTCCPVVKSSSFCCQDPLFPLSPLNSLLILLCFRCCSSLEVNSIGSFSALPLVSPSEYLSFFLLLAWFALCYILYSFFYFRVYITWFWLDHLLALVVTDVVMWSPVALYELCSHSWDYPWRHILCLPRKTSFSLCHLFPTGFFLLSINFSQYSC